MSAPVETQCVLDAIAETMGEFVDNWPAPKKIDTALALVAKTMRAALDGTPETDLQAVERAIDRMGWPEIHAFQERMQQDVYEDSGGFMLRCIKRLFGIRRDPVLTYQDAARAMLEQARTILPAALGEQSPATTGPGINLPTAEGRSEDRNTAS